MDSHDRITSRDEPSALPEAIPSGFGRRTLLKAAAVSAALIAPATAVAQTTEAVPVYHQAQMRPDGGNRR